MNTEDLGGWLEQLGLGKYADAFEENDIDWDILPELTNDDLKDLGVDLVGHRRKLLKAISALDEAAAALVESLVRGEGVVTITDVEADGFIGA